VEDRAGPAGHHRAEQLEREVVHGGDVQRDLLALALGVELPHPPEGPEAGVVAQAGDEPPRGAQGAEELLASGGVGEVDGRRDGASLLVDTLWDERLAQQMLDAMAPLVADAPIRTVVNTHSDGDHWWGNARVPADAEIVTSNAALQIMRAGHTSEMVRFKRLA